MKYRSFILTASSVLAIGTLPATANAATEKVLYSFPANSYPYGRPDQDSKGAIYGTGYQLSGTGAIYRLKQKNGQWGYKTLFSLSGSRGAYPFSGVLVDRSTSILYGTTLSGGNSNDGTVYSLAPAGRSWNQTVLHSFTGSDGYEPYPLLLKDKASGNLYGTTFYGGTHGCGTFFQLAQSNGNWTFSTLYNFEGGSSHGCDPFTQLKAGPKSGTLIGSTNDNFGRLFQLKERRGVWSESVVYNFTGGSDGAYPYDLDADGNGTIYGVTESGGVYNQGVVFQLAPNARKWTYSVIYNFRGGTDGSDGAGINFDSATGYLYGTTYQGGTAGKGTAFRLAKSGNNWTETILHSFAGGADGANPQSRPVVDRTTGALYGTTVFGGNFNGGTVYAVQP